MYSVLGGKDGLAKIVDDFYEIMHSDPDLRELMATHQGLDAKQSAQKLKAFLSGWTGGPQEYLETYGHPRLRMRHSPFVITPTEATQWLLCMRKALLRSPLAPSDQEQFLHALEHVTEMLVNRH